LPARSAERRGVRSHAERGNEEGGGHFRTFFQMTTASFES
jgi:hypothetical protein